MIRLNLGCGNDVRPDYTNVDFRAVRPEVQVADLSTLPWMWTDNSVQEVMMLDFLEHFEFAKAKPILLECRRILHTGGLLVVQVPDMQICARAIVGMSIPCNQCGEEMPTEDENGHCWRCHQDWDDVKEVAIKRMYGGQDFPGNYHMNGFTKSSLHALLTNTGFVGQKFVEEDHMRDNWNLKLVARKF